MKKFIVLLCSFLVAFSSKSFAEFSEVPGGKKAISITVDQATGKLWIIGDDNKIYMQENNEWKEHPDNGKGRHLAVYNNVPYVVAMGNAVWKGEKGAWQQLPKSENAIRVAVDGKNGTIYFMGKDGQVNRFEKGAWTKLFNYGPGSELTIHEGKPFIRGQHGFLHKWDEGNKKFVLVRTGFVVDKICGTKGDRIWRIGSIIGEQFIADYIDGVDNAKWSRVQIRRFAVKEIAGYEKQCYVIGPDDKVYTSPTP